MLRARALVVPPKGEICVLGKLIHYPAQMVQPRDDGSKLFLVDQGPRHCSNQPRRPWLSSDQGSGDIATESQENQMILAGDVGGTCNPLRTD
jgi:hypothetical protein